MYEGTLEGPVQFDFIVFQDVHQAAFGTVLSEGVNLRVQNTGPNEPVQIIM